MKKTELVLRIVLIIVLTISVSIELSNKINFKKLFEVSKPVKVEEPRFIERPIIISCYSKRPDGKIEVIESVGGGLEGVFIADSSLSKVLTKAGGYLATFERNKKDKLMNMVQLETGIKRDLDSAFVIVNLKVN